MLEKFEADRGWKKSFGGGLEEGTDWWSISYTGSGSILNTILFIVGPQLVKY